MLILETQTRTFLHIILVILAANNTRLIGHLILGAINSFVIHFTHIMGILPILSMVFLYYREIVFAHLKNYYKKLILFKIIVN